MKAAGNVRSTLQPPEPPKPGVAASEVKMPAMLKQDQPVQVLAAALDYDGATALAVYHGAARLFQGDTSIKGEKIEIDNKAGNLVSVAESGSYVAAGTTTNKYDKLGRLRMTTDGAGFSTSVFVRAPGGVLPPAREGGSQYNCDGKGIDALEVCFGG